jgi:urease accessory protein
MRIAWHLGNRHTPTELADGAIYIARDHVLADMIVGLGGEVRAVTRPFEPEGGAYGGHGPLHSGHHHHGHSHGHSHDHDHPHDHHHDAPPATRVWRPG